MEEFWMVAWEQLDFLLRIFIAGVCGGMIGYERKNRHKEAGVRTHLMVALASALMMVISKYGFNDIISDTIKLDPSRVAAGIVTGVGFLGTGMIFMRKHTINGLTTSAGIWATVGVGMAIGGGMYFIGIATTLMIVVLQIILHKNLRILRNFNTERVCIKIREQELDGIRETFAAQDIQIMNVKVERQEEDILLVKMDVNFPAKYDAFRILDLLKSQTGITSIEL